MYNNTIKTYIVNLKNRIDRKEYILKEFSTKRGFDICFFDAITNKIPAVGLYESLKGVVEFAKMHDLPYVLFCEDDHEFTEHFYYEKLIEQIDIVDQKKADILLGGVSWFDYGVKLSSNLNWINGVIFP